MVQPGPEPIQDPGVAERYWCYNSRYVHLWSGGHQLAADQLKSIYSDEREAREEADERKLFRYVQTPVVMLSTEAP